MTEVDLDPDGLAPVLLVEAPTGVVYLHQCGGVTCLQRRLEGFLVPLVAPEGAAAALTRVFHDEEDGCIWGSVGARLGADRLEGLRAGVATLRTWEVALALDEGRHADVVEALVPVTSAHGAAWLLWANCD